MKRIYRTRAGVSHGALSNEIRDAMINQKQPKQGCAPCNVKNLVTRVCLLLDQIPRDNSTQWQRFNQELQELKQELQLFEVCSLSAIHHQLSQEQVFQRCLSKMEKQVLAEIGLAIKEVLPFISGQKELAPNLKAIMHHQYRFALNTLASHIQQSGVIEFIFKHLSSVFEHFSFRNCDEFQQAEFEAAQEYGLDQQDIFDLCERADHTKQQIIRQLQNNASLADTLQHLHNHCSIVISKNQEHPNQAYILAGVNALLLCHTIDSGLWDISLLAGLMGCLFG